MTIQDLADISCVKLKTAKSQLKNVPGISSDGEIPAGSRLPYDVHRYRFNNISKRRDALLQATYHYRYVDHHMLAMEENPFNEMVKELVEAEFLRENGSNNPYGANRYDTTLAYEDIGMMKMAKRIAIIAGKFAGAAAGELMG